MSGAPSTLEVAAAIVAHAVRDGMGDEPPWEDVLAGLCRLRDDPSGAAHLAKAVGALNDKEAVVIIGAWLARLLDIDETKAREAGRKGTVLLQPLQAGTFGIAGAATLAMVIGTLGPLAGLTTLAASIVAAGVTTFGRWRVSRAEDTRKRDADRTKRMMASVAAAGK